MERMSRKILYWAALLCTLAALCSCGGYNQILKSRDSELKYRTALEYFDQKKYQKAANLFSDVAEDFAGTMREDTVVFFTAASFYFMGDHDTSGSLFDDFRRRYGRSPFLEEAEYMYAMGYYYSSPAPERDQTNTTLALMAIDTYLERYPNSDKREEMLTRVGELTQKLHDKAYLNAKTYYDTGKYKAAVVALKNAIDRYPESNHREELMFLVLKSGFELAENSIVVLQRDRYQKALDYYYSFAGEYPESRYIKEADKMERKAQEFLARFSEDENANSTENSNTDGD